MGNMGAAEAEGQAEERIQAGVPDTTLGLENIVRPKDTVLCLGNWPIIQLRFSPTLWRAKAGSLLLFLFFLGLLGLSHANINTIIKTAPVFRRIIIRFLGRKTLQVT